MENKMNYENEEGPMIHSQVVKIKKEFEKIKEPSASLQQPEMRRVLSEIKRRQRSRSPLGLGSERSISVGN